MEKVILGAVASLVVGVVVYVLKRFLSKSDERRERVAELEKRMSEAETNLDDLKGDMREIETALSNLDDSQRELKDKLTSKLSDLREEYATVRSDVKWIRRFLEREESGGE